MRVIYFTIALIIALFAISCSTTKTNSGISNKRVINYESGCLQQDRIAELANDTLLLNDYDSAIEFVKSNSGKNHSPVDRPIIYRNIESILESARFENQSDTEIVFNYWVDRLGDLIMAEYNDETTAIIREDRMPDLLCKVLGYRVIPDETAPLISKGKLTIKLNNINAFGNE